MNYGVKKCVWTALGDVTANIIQATLVIFVIGSFISDNPKLLNTFKWVGIVYILYLAYDIYKSRPKSINSDEKLGKSFLSLIGYAILANKMITWVKTNAKIINTISACVLIVIAAIIAFMQQY